MLISIVLPCFNEEGNLLKLHERLSAVISLSEYDFELLFVDDGSTDNTRRVLADLCRKDSKMKVIELSRNFGHQAAICAGIDHANGNALIMLDADLQHPPELITEMMKKWQEGYDIVYTVRNDPKGASKFKTGTAKLFYKLINALSNTYIPENSADFRLMDEKVVAEFRKLKESDKFLRGLVSWVGFRQHCIRYDADPRYAGRSGYSLLKMIKFAFDGITSFTAFPLHVSTILGIFVSLFSFLYAVYAVCIKLFTEEALPGWASVLVAVLFLGGVQLLSLGVIGEYLNRIYTETKSRPAYIVSKIRSRSFPD